MTQYNFETREVEGKVGLEILCRGVFEYKGQRMELTNAYYNPDASPDYRPTKEEQLQMAKEVDRAINKYKLEN